MSRKSVSRRRFLQAALAGGTVAASGSLLAACGTGPQASQSTGPISGGSAPAAGATVAAGATNQAVSLPYNPPIKLFANPDGDPNNELPEGDAPNNNEFTRWAKTALGIEWEAKWLSPDLDTARQKFNLAVASNDLPDVVATSPEELMKAARAGLLVPMDDLIEKHASPLVKSLIQEFDTASDGKAFTLLRHDGKAYGFPRIADVWSSTANALWVRRDVMEELGVTTVPETLEQFEGVLTSYKEKYPDNIAFQVGSDLGGTNYVMSAHGAKRNFWYDNGNGELLYGSVQPEVKEALATLQKWYKNGWIDQEFIAKKDNTFNSGNTFAMHMPWWFVFAIADLTKNVPNAKVWPIPAFKGPNGSRVVTVGASPVSWAFGISAKSTHPEASILQLNAITESQYRNDKELRAKFDFRYPETPVQEPTNKGEITVADGTVEFKRGVWNYPAEVQGPPSWFNKYLPHLQHDSMGIVINERANQLKSQFERVGKAIAENTTDKLDAMDTEAYKGLIDRGIQYEGIFEMIRLWDAQREQGIVQYDAWSGGSTPSMVEKNAYLNTLEQETFAKIVVGEQPLDAFDGFVQQWKDGGGDKITAEVNEFYKQSKG